MKKLYEELLNICESRGEDDSNYTIEIKVTRCGARPLLKILKRLQWWGNIGHMGVCDMEYGFKAGFDGDGSDQIPSIKVNGIELEKIEEFKDIKCKVDGE